MATRQGTGFGFFPFGNHPFGRADFGVDVISRSFPEAYQEDNNGRANDLMVHYLQLIEDSVNRSKQNIDVISDQVDFDRVRNDLLPRLGSTIDVTIDSSEPVEFQRSLVGNAILFYRIKGTLASYEIRGKISGFDVTVDNLYKIAPDLVSFFPEEELFQIPPGGDTFYTSIDPGSNPAVSGDPRLEEPNCDYCLTSSIKLNFEVVKVLPPAITGEGNFFDRLATKLQDIIPIHVRDLIFEILQVICVFENENMEVNRKAIEQQHFPTSAFFRFDMTPADLVPMDFHGLVSGVVSLSG